MDKSPDAFRTISEVADWLGIPAHVLRFWESKFTHVKPVKRAGGRRYYRPADMLLLGGIKKLLHDDGLTIKGVQKILHEQGIGQVSSLSQSLDEPATGGPIAGDGTVLAFKARQMSQPTSPDSEQLELRAEPAPEAPESSPPTAPESPPVEAEKPVVAPAVPPAETAPETPPEPAPVAEPAATEQTPEPAADSPPEPAFRSASARPSAPPEKPTEKPAAEGTPEVAADPPAQKPILPSFLHRPAPRTPDQVQPAAPKPVSEPAPEPAAVARARVVDAPDPPDESDLPYSPGLLGRLAGLRSLPPDQAREIAPLAKQLREHLTRTGTP